MPFRVTRPTIITRLGWLNGNSALASNFDIGIYSAAWARLTSAGSTARSGVATWQWVDTADVTLLPGFQYYLACVNDSATGGQIRGWNTSTGINSMFGIQDSATDAFPLPDPLTNMAAASSLTRIPMVAMGAQLPA